MNMKYMHKALDHWEALEHEEMLELKLLLKVKDSNLKDKKAIRKKTLKEKRQEQKAKRLRIKTLKDQGLCSFCGVTPHSFVHHQVREARLRIIARNNDKVPTIIQWI